jgi:dienelactone hydrolase
VAHELVWREESAQSGVRCRRFDVRRDDRVVPGLWWGPDPSSDDATRPMVLLGHGGSGHKGQDYVAALARRLVRRLGCVAAAIDGPVHGDRRADGGAAAGLTLLEFSQAWVNDQGLTDAMVEDWRAVIDVLEVAAGGGGRPLAYWGLSMGTIFGLPLVAADRRIGAAVLGLMGLTGPTRARIVQDAPRVTCPVLFLLQWDDELFPRASALELFDALGTADKRLHAHPGRHGAVPAEEFAASLAFLAPHLAVGGAAASGRSESGSPTG